MSNTLKTRIKHRVETSDTWEEVTATPLDGELLVYRDAAGNTQLKCGNGNNSAKDLPFISNSYTNTTPLLNDVGGIKASAHPNGFSNVPIEELITELLYPYTAPVITSISLKNASGTVSGGVYEQGESITITSASVNVTKKSKPIASVAMYVGNSAVATVTTGVTNGGQINIPLDAAVTISNNTTVTVKVTDTDDTTVPSAGVQFTFVYPYYYGVVESASDLTATVITGLTKDVTSKGKKTYTYTTTLTQRPVVAYPLSYGKLQKIQDKNNFEQNWGEPEQVSIEGVNYYVYAGPTSAADAFPYTFIY